MRTWKRNAVVATVVMFVCVALYLSWSYNRVPDETQVFDPSAGSTVTELSASDKLSGSGTDIGGATLVDTGMPESTETGSAASSGSNYFAEARLSRQQARDSALTILKEAADRDAASQDVKDKAASEIEALANNAMAEARIESLVVAKGYTDCVAYRSADGVNVVVAAPADGLTAADVSKIKDIVVSETKLTAESIKIVEVKA